LDTMMIPLVGICFNSVTNKRYIDSKKRDLLRYTVFHFMGKLFIGKLFMEANIYLIRSISNASNAKTSL
jgi:hypothetical protein